jgi:hypothetical protein
MRIRTGYFFLLFFSIAAALLPASRAHAQRSLKGRVIYKKDSKPASRATVRLIRHAFSTITDDDGNFTVPVKKNDTLVISSVGYENIRLPIDEAMDELEFALQERSSVLETVTVRFRSSAAAGAMKSNMGFFRSWDHAYTRGEMGRIFILPYPAYMITKVQLKVSTLCRNCQLRLHIRDVVDGKPGRELLTDSIGISIKAMKLDDRAAEFDLGSYELVLDQKKIFVGIEVINCERSDQNDCTFLFAGTEEGKYTLKNSAKDDWETMDSFTPYIKLLLRF